MFLNTLIKPSQRTSNSVQPKLALYVYATTVQWIASITLISSY